MARPNDKHRVREHYDRVSPYYHALWGEHLHHGYWIRGDESKETARLQLVQHLSQLAFSRASGFSMLAAASAGAASIWRRSSAQKHHQGQIAAESCRAEWLGIRALSACLQSAARGIFLRQLRLWSCCRQAASTPPCGG